MASKVSTSGVKEAGHFLPSPAETGLGSASYAASSTSSDLEYQLLEGSVRASTSSGPKKDPLFNKQTSTKEKKNAKCGMPMSKCALTLASIIVLLGVLAGVLYAGSTMNVSLTGPEKPRIWDPDLNSEFRSEPLAKSVIRKFDAYNMARGGRDDVPTFTANVDQYLAPDLFYESVGFGNWHTPSGWARGEEHNYGTAFPQTVFTQMLFFGDSHVATTTTYGSAFWSGDLLGLQAPKRWVNLRILDFYNIREEKPGWGRVSYNFMMIDWADTLRQIGLRVLPPAPLPEGLVLPPSANDGVPAPLTVLVQAEGRDPNAARTVVEQALIRDWAGEPSEASSKWHEDMIFYGPAGIGLAKTRNEYETHVLAPFRAAFSNRTVVTQLSACEGNYCAVLGRIQGQGVGSWLGLPTAGKNIALRFGMHWRVVGDKAKEGWAIFDYPGLFEQVGLDFWHEAANRQSRA